MATAAPRHLQLDTTKEDSGVCALEPELGNLYSSYTTHTPKLEACPTAGRRLRNSVSSPLKRRQSIRTCNLLPLVSLYMHSVECIKAFDTLYRWSCSPVVLGIPDARPQPLRGPELRELEQEDPTLLEVRVHRLFGAWCCKGFYVARNVLTCRFWWLKTCIGRFTMQG